MRLGTLIKFARNSKGKKPWTSINPINGLTSGQIRSNLRITPDLLEPDRCIQLQELYSRAPTIPSENFENFSQSTQMKISDLNSNT